MKKIISVFLATVMLFSLCATSVFAEEITTTPPYGDDEYYSNSDEELLAYGWVNFNPATDITLLYGVMIKNLQDSRVTYGYNMQCAVNYDDETQDFDYAHGYVTLNYEENASRNSFVLLYTDKTVVYIDAEFHVNSSGYEKWMGFIGQTLTLGINA